MTIKELMSVRGSDFVPETNEFVLGEHGAVVYFDGKSWIFVDASGNYTELCDETLETVLDRI